MGSLGDRFAALSSSKQALLAQRLRQQGGTAPALRGIPRRQEAGPAPLSFAQERLWFLDQLQPGSSAYNITRGYRLTGPLDLPAIERALNEIRRRHGALRTRFDSGNEQPLQIIDPFQPVVLQVIDLTHLSEEQHEAAWRHALSAQTRIPFDLKTDQPMRTCLLRLRPEAHVLLVVIHHIVSDGWSSRLLTAEIAALYEAFAQGGESPLPELPIQYIDYAYWQREGFGGSLIEGHLAYWKKHLGGELPLLELPTDYARPSLQSFNGARCSMVLPKSLLDSLITLSRQRRATLFMTMLAAFAILLHRLTGQEDIIVGTPVAGRVRQETEGLIGLFLNTLALRMDLSGNPTYEEALRRVRAVTLDAFTHENLPFEKLVQELHPERSLSHAPLFQVMFNLLLTEDAEGTYSGVKIETLTIQEAESKYDLTLYVRTVRGEVRLDLVFNTDLFSTARMEGMLDQFGHLLEQIAANPDRPIRAFSLVTKGARRILSDPTAPLPEPRFGPVTSEFLSWAKQAPTQAAVLQAGQSWTYQDLAEGAQLVARTLKGHGVGRADVVAVSGPRCFGLIAGVMGVLLGGGVMLTLDRGLPAKRQRMMLSEARARYLLYIGEWRGEDRWLRTLTGLTVIPSPNLDALAGREGSSPLLEELSLPEVMPDDWAYIFFTSGTTGVPKGVLGCHKSLSHFLTWQRSTFNIGPGDRCSHLTNLSFDAVLRDIFLPLISGATLCLPNECDDPVTGEMLSWLDCQGITIFHAVPTLAQSWLGIPHDGVSLRTLRWAFFAGEALTEAFVRRWRNAFPQTGGIVNLYGPTETTLVKCFHVIPDEPSPGVQPIGMPLPQSQALVLTEDGQLCGLGESGEIVLRTPFRALGYINAPEEQRRRFVKNPFRDDLRDLMYYTGDRGRYRPDGTLEILGRLDDQVKVRGVRVEPDEITAFLGQHPRVKVCFVAARKDRLGDSILVAYVVPLSANALNVRDLRSYLGTHLPTAMVPSAFVFLEALPLAPNGKVNRRALPEPDLMRPEFRDSFVPPRTPIECTLAGIFGDVLRLERVGSHHSFFELGGHSLLASRVVSRIRNTFGVDLPLRTLFEAPTVAELAAAIAVRLDRSPAREGQERLLAELEQLSEAEATRLLAQALPTTREGSHA